jgi:hypothetical protein
MLLVSGPSLQYYLSAFICFIMFITGYHEQLRGNPKSLLKLSACSWILMASFTKWSTQVIDLASTMVSLKFIKWSVSMLCSYPADLSCLYSYMSCPCSLHLVPMVRPVYPTYTLQHSQHSHGIGYTPQTARPRSSFTSLKKQIFCFIGMCIVFMLNWARGQLIPFEVVCI